MALAISRRLKRLIDAGRICARCSRATMIISFRSRNGREGAPRAGGLFVSIHAEPFARHARADHRVRAVRDRRHVRRCALARAKGE